MILYVTTQEFTSSAYQRNLKFPKSIVKNEFNVSTNASIMKKCIFKILLPVC